jgi:hypothetical protein
VPMLMTEKEVWKSVPNARQWQINQRGIVRSIAQPERTLTRYYHKDHERLEVTFWNPLTKKSRTASVALMVAELFIGSRPPGWAIAFRDGDRCNTDVDNLYYRPFARKATSGKSSEGRA